MGRSFLKHNYDTVAWCYDRFSRLVFGNAQVAAQVSLLSFIPQGAHILIAGGGTGWILEEIAKIHPSGLTITYVDASEKMIALAQKRNTGNNTVSYHTTDVEELFPNRKYDVVITSFFFDNFRPDKAVSLFAAIDRMLDTRSLWLYTDFRNTGRLSHRLLMKTMYAFFRICCGVEATQMPDMDTCFKQRHYLTVAQRPYMNGFITALVYKKSIG